MSARIVGKNRVMIVVKGRLSKDEAEADRLCNELTSPEGRVNTVAKMALLHYKMKGADIDALRLDRAVRVVQKKWRS